MEFLILSHSSNFSGIFVLSAYSEFGITIVEQCNLFEIQLEDPHELQSGVTIFSLCIPLTPKVSVSHVGLFINRRYFAWVNLPNWELF